MIEEIITYQDLLDALALLTNDQRAQPIQIADPPCNGKPTALARGIALGTVGEFEFGGCRSSVDNKYHAKEIVLLIDGNPFGEDGAMSYTMKREGPEEKPLSYMVPNYGPGGPTSREEQRPPGWKPPTERDEIKTPAYVGTQCVRRTTDFHKGD